MISRRFSLWQKAAALAPVLLLLAYLPAQMMLRCRIDGLLRPACCCPQDSQRPSPGPVVKAQDCCDQEVAQTERPEAEAAGVPDRHQAPPSTLAVVAAAVSPAAPATERIDRRAGRSGPAREGPRIILLKQAFLI